MGRPKLSLPLGDRTVLGHVIAALRRANIDHILVVIGPHVPELVPIVQAADAEYVLLAEETPDMRATVEAGLRHIEERFAPQAGDSLLLVPGDHPTLNAGVILLLQEARAGNPEKSIFIPTHKGKRGHPALIDWKHVAGMRTVPAGEGLNVYLRRQEAKTLEVPVESAEVLFDLDTPDDYRQMDHPVDHRVAITIALTFAGLCIGLVAGMLVARNVDGMLTYGFVASIAFMIFGRIGLRVFGSPKSKSST